MIYRTLSIVVAAVAGIASIQSAHAMPGDGAWGNSKTNEEGTCYISLDRPKNYQAIIGMQVNGYTFLIVNDPRYRGIYRGKPLALWFGGEGFERVENLSETPVFLELSAEALGQLRKHSWFQMIDVVDKIGSPISLKGSSKAIDVLLACHAEAAAPGNARYHEAIRALVIEGKSPDQIIASEAPPQQAPVVKAQPAQNEAKGNAGPSEKCSGFYAYADASGDYPEGLSAEVEGKSIEVIFSDFSKIFARQEVQPDNSVQFSPEPGAPIWELRCHAAGATLTKPGSQWAEGRTYQLEKASGNVFEFAKSKGIDLTSE